MKIAHDHKSLMVRKLDKNWTNMTSFEGCRMPQKCPKCLKGSRVNLPGKPVKPSTKGHYQSSKQTAHKWLKWLIENLTEGPLGYDL